MNEHAGHRSRLRETFQQNGIEGMADHQVLELLLTYALPRVDVNPLAHRLLDRFGSLERVLSARPDQLQQVRGIGEAALSEDGFPMEYVLKLRNDLENLT